METKENLIIVNKQEDIKRSEQFSLPDTDTISDWFSQDHLDRIKRIRGSDLNYSKYSVYEAYRDKGML